jgi:glyoxylase-like metal-dependent hydrolase (beta-lactamase superfamily II)
LISLGGSAAILPERWIEATKRIFHKFMKIYKVVVGSLDTNCYIVASEKKSAFIVDPGDDVARIRKVLDDEKLRAQFIVNTHGHIDHIKADADLKLPVYIHENDGDLVRDPEKNLMTTFFGSFKPVIPQRLLKDGDTIELDEMVFKVIHTPGHTRGGICLWNAEVLFSGDTLFRDGVGRTDFPGASSELLGQSLKKLSALDPAVRVYPGHGASTSVGRELGDLRGRDG